MHKEPDSSAQGCHEYRQLDRRRFLEMGSMSAMAAALPTTVRPAATVPTASRGAPSSTRLMLIGQEPFSLRLSSIFERLIRGP